MELLLIILALGPNLAWMYWIWRADKYHREPKRLVLLLLFVGGLIAVASTLVVVDLYEAWVPAEEEAPIINMLLTAALPEELFKMLPIFLFAWRSKHWEEPFDGIVYAGATALGFNLIETVFYMLEEESIGGSLYQGIIRGTLGGHMVYGIIMGFFLSGARFSNGGRRWRNIGLAWLVPAALHTAWNASLTYGGEVTAGDEVAGTVAWALSTGLWLLACEYMRRNREATLLAHTVQIAPTLCWHCQKAYPVGAGFCQTCGAQVVQVNQAAAP